MEKILKRRVVIRENDFLKVKKEALRPHPNPSLTLYDRAYWTPINKKDLERELLIKAIKYGHLPKGGCLTIPSDYLLYIQLSLYNKKYCSWNPRYDDEDFLVVQPRKNLPVSILGWGIFEKDIISVRSKDTRLL